MLIPRIAVVCFLVSFHISHGQEEKPSVAVLDFASIGCEPSLGLAASEILRTELGSIGRYRIIERAQLLRVMEEQSLQVSGAVDEESVVELGKMLGAKIVVVGSLVRTGKTYTLNSRFIDVETAEVKKSQNVRGNSEDEISNMCASLAKIISDDSAAKAVVPRDLQHANLGRVLLVDENDFTGIWTRRGESNVFDAVWFLKNKALRSELTFAGTPGQKVEINRIDQGKPLGRYQGASSMAGRRYHGSASWSPTVSWSAEVYSDVPAVRPGQEDFGALWIVQEGDYTGIWKRFEQSDNYEAAYYLNQEALRAVLTVESIEESQIRIKRSSDAGVLGYYTGRFTTGNRYLSGGASWSESVVWSAEVFY